MACCGNKSKTTSSMSTPRNKNAANPFTAHVSKGFKIGKQTPNFGMPKVKTSFTKSR